MSRLSEFEVFAKTIFGEARGEPKEGQIWVGWVIKNRAHYRGQSIKDVCLAPQQFECWNGRNDINTSREEGTYRNIYSLAQRIYNASISEDPTGRCQHFNNPQNEDADWIHRATRRKRIGNHVFYWFD